MPDWFHEHETLLWWLIAASVVTFVGTLIVVPILAVRIPADYFAHGKRHHTPWADQHPIVQGVLMGAKNLVGLVFIVVGIAMLLMPGQGILTIVIGLMLVNFPGKYRFERWLVRRGPVHRAIDWLRRRAGKEPLLLEETAP